MKYKSLKGKEFTLTFGKKWKNESRSKFQAACAEVIKTRYPHDQILEEFYVPHDKFYIDFFIPARAIALEIQGRQHGAFVKHFHKTRRNFISAQDRDLRKQKWCDLNRVALVSVYSIEELKEKLGVE